MNDVKFFTVNNILFFQLLPGTAIQPVAFGSLQPGTKVFEIGQPGRNGKITSSHRVDEWFPWIQYEGTITLRCPQVEETSLCVVFKLPPGGMKTAKGKEIDFDVFVLFHVITNKEIMRNIYSPNGSVRIFSAVFKQFETNKLIIN